MMFSDEQLRDYLAGTLPSEDAARLEEEVAQDPALGARLFDLDYARATPLRDAFEPVPDAARLKDLETLVLNANVDGATSKPQVSWKWSAATAAAAFAVGAFLFSGPTGQDEPSWQDQVAVYQTLYVAETLASTVTNDEELTVQLERSARAVGRTLPLDIVGNLEGMKLLRAQVLGFEGAPLIQMAYLSDDGVPVALCAIRLTAPATDELTLETLSGLPVVHWSDGRFGYMVVGDIEGSLLMEIAETVSTSL